MPELPEVETTARGLRARLIGRRVEHVGHVDWPRMLPNASEADLAEALIGHRVVEIDRRGKYVLIGFDDDVWLSVHRKMSGNLLLQPAAAAAPLHTHLDISFDDGTALRFVDPRKFGRVHLFHTREQRDTFLAERLGPDSLVGFDVSVLAAKLRGRRGRLKSLLLDQAFLAGVGNLYADEALWLARLHPLRTADSLTRTETTRLASAITQVLQDAIARRGTSFDASYRDADGVPGDNQAFLNAYGRESEPCPRCGRPISRQTIGGRSTHFCPRCQRLKKPPAEHEIRPPAASGSGSRT
jgi:formamidopyrimidine-DNA glycosylase